MKTAVVFRCQLLPPSETFIRSQASALRAFKACYAGIERVANGLTVPDDAVLVMHKRDFAGRLKGRLFLGFGWAPAFYRQLKEMQPELIHAHFAPDAAVALPVVARLRVPLIATLHGYDVTSSDEHLSHSITGRLYLARREKLWQKATVFLCASEFIRERALRKGFPESKLKVHYIGVDRTLFLPPHAERDRNLIVFVGRLVKKKGCVHLLRAMSRVQQAVPDVRLVILGDGPEMRSLETEAAALHIRAEFLGMQPQTAVREWLGRAGLLCAPSVTASDGDSEGLPTVLVEAQALGLPVVSSWHAGIPEIVQNGNTGLLAPEGDEVVLAQHMVRILTDEPFWNWCSEHAIELVKQRFDLHAQTRQLETIYQESIAREGAVAGNRAPT